MPVTLKPSDRRAEPWGQNPFYTYPQATSPEQLLQCTLSDDLGGAAAYRARNGSVGGSSSAGSSGSRRGSPELREGGGGGGGSPLVQSSFDASALAGDRHVYGTKNGLVHACLEAYNMHHHLVLRPEDVWFAILSQLGAHVRANSARMRHLFFSNGTAGSGATASADSDSDGVAGRDHEQQPPQQHLHIEVPIGSADHGQLAFRMAKMMASRLRDESLREWVLPAFTTTDRVDQAVAAVLLMGAMQRFFTYSWGTRCGLPSVTLLGEREDWELIRNRCADRLADGSWGKHAAEWWRRALRPALDGFVESFRDPTGQPALRFWQAMCDAHRPNGSGTTTYSGWITAFCYWDEKGRCLHKDKATVAAASSSSSSPETSRPGSWSVQLARSDVPMGFCRVPVTLLDNGTPIRTEMVAGSVGIRVSSHEQAKAGRRLGLDTVQPETGWFMYRVQ